MQQVQYVKIGNIISNPNNPRTLKDAKFEKLVQSLVDFPEMLEKRPLICVTTASGKFMVLGGNQRLKAATKAGIKQLPVILADDWSEEKRQEFIVKDNVNFGSFDWDMLTTEWNEGQLIEWGLEMPEGEQPFENSDNEFGGTSNELTNMIVISLTEEEAVQWIKTKEQLKVKQDKKAFFELIKQFGHETSAN